MYLAALGQVTFIVRGEHNDFSEYEFQLATEHDRVDLHSIERNLDLHEPPLRIKTVSGKPAVARPEDGSLAVDFQNGDKLELIAEINPGDSTQEFLS